LIAITVIAGILLAVYGHLGGNMPRMIALEGGPHLLIET